jgi:hypothetical protein
VREYWDLIADMKAFCTAFTKDMTDLHLDALLMPCTAIVAPLHGEVRVLQVYAQSTIVHSQIYTTPHPTEPFHVSVGGSAVPAVLHIPREHSPLPRRNCARHRRKCLFPNRCLRVRFFSYKLSVLLLVRFLKGRPIMTSPGSRRSKETQSLR